MLDYPVLLLLPVALLYAAAMDVLTMTIPNRISLALIAGFPLAAFLAGLSMHDVLMHVAAFAVMLAFCIALFAFNALGGGDGKLLAATALWLGMDHLLSFTVTVAVCGGVLAILVLTFRRLPVSAFPAPDWAFPMAWRSARADCSPIPTLRSSKP